MRTCGAKNDLHHRRRIEALRSVSRSGQLRPLLTDRYLEYTEGAGEAKFAYVKKHADAERHESEIVIASAPQTVVRGVNPPEMGRTPHCFTIKPPLLYCEVRDFSGLVSALSLSLQGAPSDQTR